MVQFRYPLKELRRFLKILSQHDNSYGQLLKNNPKRQISDERGIYLGSVTIISEE